MLCLLPVLCCALPLGCCDRRGACVARPRPDAQVWAWMSKRYALPNNMRQTLPLHTRPWQIANRNKEVCKGKACTDGRLYNKSPFCR